MARAPDRANKRKSTCLDCLLKIDDCLIFLTMLVSGFSEVCALSLSFALWTLLGTSRLMALTKGRGMLGNVSHRFHHRPGKGAIYRASRPEHNYLNNGSKWCILLELGNESKQYDVKRHANRYATVITCRILMYFVLLLMGVGLVRNKWTVRPKRRHAKCNTYGTAKCCGVSHARAHCYSPWQNPTLFPVETRYSFSPYVSS